MSSIYTTDLLSQRSQIQSEIQNLEKSIADKRILLGFLENIIKQAEQRDLEVRSHDVATNSKKEIPIVSPTIIEETLTKDMKKEVKDFLIGQPNQAARTSSITSSIAWGNRDNQLKVSNAITQLCKYWEIQIIKEYDSTGAERQRNRLYQLTALV
jgi:hypothetical protein